MGELDAIKKAQFNAAADAAEIWAQHVRGEAQRIAPLEEGTLAASGTVTRQYVAGGVDLTISLDRKSVV